MPARLLVMMMGVQGVGKTHFARQLAAGWPAAHFSTDAIRRELYGSYGRYKWEGDYDQNHGRVFDLFNRRVESALKAGRSVVRDYGQNYRRTRQSGYKLADRFGVLALTVWVQAPAKVAILRGSNRPDGGDQFRFSPEYMREIVSKSLIKLEPPGDDEPHVIVDGQAGFGQQYEEFCSFLRSINS